MFQRKSFNQTKFHNIYFNSNTLVTVVPKSSSPMDPSPHKDPGPFSQSISNKRQNFRNEIVKDQKARIKQNLRKKYFGQNFDQILENNRFSIIQSPRNPFSNIRNNFSPQARDSPLALQRSRQRRSVSFQLFNNVTPFEVKPEPNHREPEIYRVETHQISNQYQNVNDQNICQYFSQPQIFQQNEVIHQPPFENSPVRDVIFNIPSNEVTPLPISQNQYHVQMNSQNLQEDQINPQCYQNSQGEFQNQNYSQMNFPAQQNLTMNYPIQRNVNLVQSPQKNIQVYPSYQKNVHFSPQPNIQINHPNLQPRAYMSPSQNIHLGSPQINSNINPILPQNQLSSTPPRLEQPMMVNSQISPQLPLSPSNNLNISFGGYLSASSPQINPNTYMDLTFSNQIIFQSQISPQSHLKTSPNQINVLSQSLLSNEKVLEQPNYVNPQLDFVEGTSQKRSTNTVLPEIKKEEEIKPSVQENFKIQSQFTDSTISPFSKNKKNQAKTYSALKVLIQERKKEQEPQYLENLFKKNKKTQDLPNSTGKKLQNQPQVEKKQNPEKSKHQNPVKKQPAQIQDMSKEIINFNLLLRQHTIIKMYKHFVVFDKVLGKGSFAVVYLGANTQTKQMVAVKKMKIKRVKQMFEVDYLKEICHKNVIALLDYCMEESTKLCYLFLEYCPENLRERLQIFKKQKWSDERELQARVSYIEQMIEGMNALNQKGFLHRDIKFENMLVKDNVLKIGDFGLCRKMNQKLELESVRCGTPYTMAPEIYFHPKNADNNPIYTEKSDIFSLAVIFHELIYNLHPFSYEEKHLRKFERVDTTQKDSMIKEISKQLGFKINWIQTIINKGLKPLEQRLTWEELMNIYMNRNSTTTENQNIGKKEDSSKFFKPNKEQLSEKSKPLLIPEIQQKSDKKLIAHQNIEHFDVARQARKIFEQQQKRIRQSEKKKLENDEKNPMTIKKAKQTPSIEKPVKTSTNNKRKISFEEDFKSFCDMPTEVSHHQNKQQNLENLGASKFFNRSNSLRNQTIMIKDEASNNMKNIMMAILMVCLLMLVFDKVFLSQPISIKS